MLFIRSSYFFFKKVMLSLYFELIHQSILSSSKMKWCECTVENDLYILKGKHAAIRCMSSRGHWVGGGIIIKNEPGCHYPPYKEEPVGTSFCCLRASWLKTPVTAPSKLPSIRSIWSFLIFYDYNFLHDNDEFSYILWPTSHMIMMIIHVCPHALIRFFLASWIAWLVWHLI